TGLGLAISRKIAESHEGTLTLDPATRTGSRFVIWLPVPGSLRSSSQMR
ncbi:MAG TPA: ATP-binding protein, partial [Verrucomicrobiae bacterium]|nr:ATP-binding protein [Verrucomicrobiae bacterium]